MPTSQVQDTTPEPEAIAGSRPAAPLGPEAYSTSIEQAAPGAVRTVAVTRLPWPVAGRLTNLTDSAGAGGRVAGGAVVGGRVVAGGAVVAGRVVAGRAVVGETVVTVADAAAAALVEVAPTWLVGALTNEPTTPETMRSPRMAVRMINHGCLYQGRCGRGVRGGGGVPQPGSGDPDLRLAGEPHP